MTDYLQPVHKRWRWISIAGCFAAFLGCVFIDGVIGWVIFRRHTITYNTALLSLSLFATFVALLGFAALFSAWRIFHGKSSGNGLTWLPTRFIQAFGLFMFLTHGAVFFLHGSVFSSSKDSSYSWP